MIKCFVGFDQPFERSDFEQLVKSQALSLEEICFDDSIQGVFSIVGFARVDNRAFEKIVFVRVTEDGWKTFKDVEAHYFLDNAASNTDTFQFEFELSGEAADFALCYRVNGETYWDNNLGQNYSITTKKNYYYVCDGHCLSDVPVHL